MEQASTKDLTKFKDRWLTWRPLSHNYTDRQKRWTSDKHMMWYPKNSSTCRDESCTLGLGELSIKKIQKDIAIYVYLLWIYACLTCINKSIRSLHIWKNPILVTWFTEHSDIVKGTITYFTLYIAMRWIMVRCL